MLYLNELDIKNLNIQWPQVLNEVEEALVAYNYGTYSQPIKPYLKFNDQQNRIIAMPAYLGEKRFDVAGIKWISSFPGNLKLNKPRAHSVVILNDSNTGEPLCILNTALISIIRTVGVSGTILNKYLESTSKEGLKVSIFGWGPIGQHHFQLLQELFDDFIEKYYIYDVNKDQLEQDSGVYFSDKVQGVNRWESAYDESDIVITCTTAKTPYIDRPPKDGSLLLNVSLRDYQSIIYDYVKNNIIVDDWEEVCREGTNIELMTQEKGLSKDETYTIGQMITTDYFKNLKPCDTVMVNPMGMAIFDIAIGNYVFQQAKTSNIGTQLA